jgi:hypothetical protein
MTRAEKATVHLKNFRGASYEAGTQIDKYTLPYPGLHVRV